MGPRKKDQLQNRTYAFIILRDYRMSHYMTKNAETKQNRNYKKDSKSKMKAELLKLKDP